MSNARLFRRVWVARVLICAIAGIALNCYVGSSRAESDPASLVAVSLTGVHHMGEQFNVAEFYVNGYYGSNVGRGGGGGSDVCCVMLPKKWRPGMSVEVRWAINNFSQDNHAELSTDKKRSVEGGGIFIAQVPVEQYTIASHVWVHFFSGGKVRVVSSNIASFGTEHPIQGSDPRELDSATAGKLVNAIFTKKELADMDQKVTERRKIYGDWR